MEIRVGDKVKVNHPYDGTGKAGIPEGSSFTVVKTEPFKYHYGVVGVDTICTLSNGDRVFPWNLTITSKRITNETEDKEQLQRGV
jgi:hypothetical protein